MSAFQALMALSEVQTKQSQSAVQTALAERQRNEEMRRKQLAEKERKEQEKAKIDRIKMFENERREKDRQQKLEQERAAREAMLQKREEEARNALLYGPKKAKTLSNPDGPSPSWPSSSSQNRVREEVRKRRLPNGDEDDNDSAPEFLTREEKRERKQLQEKRRIFNASKRSSNASSYSKAGRRLPGGAVDLATSSQSDSPKSSQSVKQRLAAMPNTLTKLNTVKRDTRTIDEILQDRAKAREIKVLDGEDARGFDDWFGTTKKNPTAKPSAQSGASATSGANTPVSRGSSTPQLPSVSSKKVQPPLKPSLLKTAATKAAASMAIGTKSPVDFRGVSDNTQTKAAIVKPSKPSTAFIGKNASKSNVPAAKKRPRSPSLSDSDSPPPPPPKKHATSNIKDTIWELFGRNRETYVSRDVFSDDEDMEADAIAVEREEKFSSRVALREDNQALEEERRREEDKRRRKKEREARERRG